MFLDDDVAFPRREIGVPFTAPRAFRKEPPLPRRDLARARMVPAIIVADLPTMTRHDEHLNTGLADRGGDGSQIIEKPDLPGELPNRCSSRMIASMLILLTFEKRDRGMGRVWLRAGGPPRGPWWERIEEAAGCPEKGSGLIGRL